MLKHVFLGQINLVLNYNYKLESSKTFEEVIQTKQKIIVEVLKIQYKILNSD